MARGIAFAVLAAPLLLAACAAPEAPARFSARDAGFETVRSRTDTALSKRAVWAQSQAETLAVAEQVRAMTRGKTLGADSAVQVALLNNKALQAAYARIGLSAAEAWQQATPENPVISVGLLGIGAPEVGLLRALEAVIAVNLLDRRSRAQRVAAADAAFQQAQMEAVVETLALAHETRLAWIDAVAAFEAVSHLKRAAGTTDAGAELAQQLGKTGALNKAAQGREQLLNAEMAAELARARLDAQLAKERLARLMGLWGGDLAFYVPDALPAVPRAPRGTGDIERLALANRADLAVARLALEATARAHGLTDATRRVTDLELIAGAELEREPDEGGGVETSVAPQVELEFAIPIYDSGKARMRKAELAYLQAANLLAERAVAVRSEARAAAFDYGASHQIARHYADVVIPLQRGLEEQALLANNGMIESTFDLIAQSRARIASELAAARAKRDFWRASAGIAAAVYGGGAGGGDGAGGGAAGPELAGGSGAKH